MTYRESNADALHSAAKGHEARRGFSGLRFAHVPPVLLEATSRSVAVGVGGSVMPCQVCAEVRHRVKASAAAHGKGCAYRDGGGAPALFPGGA